MTHPAPVHPDAIFYLPSERGATITRTGRIFRYQVRYSSGIAILERDISSHLTLGLAKRAARRFLRGPKVDGEIVRRYGVDEQGNGMETAP